MWLIRVQNNFSMPFCPQAQPVCPIRLERAAWRQTRILCFQEFASLRKSWGHETLSEFHRTCQWEFHWSFRLLSLKLRTQEQLPSKLERCMFGESVPERGISKLRELLLKPIPSFCLFSSFQFLRCHFQLSQAIPLCYLVFAELFEKCCKLKILR